jgi:hypothetical protein
MNKTAFILSLFSLATGVSFATETPKPETTVSDNLDPQDEQQDEKEEQKDEQQDGQGINAIKEPIASADDQDHGGIKSSSLKADLVDDSAEEENADTKSVSTGTEKEDKKDDHDQHNIDLPETDAEPEKKESDFEPKSVKKKKKSTKRKPLIRKPQMTSDAALQAERNQNGMQPQRCPASSSADSEAVAVVSDNTCTTS